MQKSEFTIDIRNFIGEYTASAFHVLINRSYITDYFLPFALAVYVIIISL